MTAVPHESLTYAQFPDWEERQSTKHEFVQGHAYAFAGGTTEHSAIAAMLLSLIVPAAAPCRTYGSDVLLATGTSYRYPDVSVSCDVRDHAAGLRVIRYPVLIVEVLSESTHREDLGPKLVEYQTLDSLEEYLAVDSRKRWAQLWRRGGSWSAEPEIAGGPLELHSVDLTIDLDAIYAMAAVPTSSLSS